MTSPNDKQPLQLRATEPVLLTEREPARFDEPATERAFPLVDVSVVAPKLWVPLVLIEPVPATPGAPRPIADCAPVDEYVRVVVPPETVTANTGPDTEIFDKNAEEALPFRYWALRFVFRALEDKVRGAVAPVAVLTRVVPDTEPETVSGPANELLPVPVRLIAPAPP